MRRALLALLVLVGACGGGDEPDTNRAVTERIEALEDCAALQEEFDRADRNGRTDYMEEADSRMREIGCYEDGR